MGASDKELPRSARSAFAGGLGRGRGPWTAAHWVRLPHLYPEIRRLRKGREELRSVAAPVTKAPPAARLHLTPDRGRACKTAFKLRSTLSMRAMAASARLRAEISLAASAIACP